MLIKMITSEDDITSESSMDAGPIRYGKDKPNPRTSSLAMRKNLLLQKKYEHKARVETSYKTYKQSL